MESTGNRWVNQDTGQIANPGNVQSDMATVPMAQKFGPAVLGDASAPVSDSPSAAVAGAEELPELEGRALGPAVRAETPDQLEAQRLETDKLRIRSFGKNLKDPDKGTQKMAQQALAAEAKREYGRADGGRRAIKAVLSSYGFSKPEE